MNGCRHLKPCQYIRGGRVCGKTPTTKVTKYEYEKTGKDSDSFIEKIVGVKYFCQDHIPSECFHDVFNPPHIYQADL